jgi:TetR/AcrR family transcriptional repressor of nem operon
MGAFWRSGYKGTSLSDLETATGLTKGSLYKAFEDKHDLFLQALEMYLQQSRATIFAGMNAPGTAIDRLIAWTDLASASCSKGGCLAVKASDEMAAEDPEVRRILAEHWGEVEGFLSEIIAGGQAEGSIRADLPVSTVVTLLTRVAMGTVVAAPLAADADPTVAMRAAINLIKA